MYVFKIKILTIKWLNCTVTKTELTLNSYKLITLQIISLIQEVIRMCDVIIYPSKILFFKLIIKMNWKSSLEYLWWNVISTITLDKIYSELLLGMHQYNKSLLMF